MVLTGTLSLLICVAACDRTPQNATRVVAQHAASKQPKKVNRPIVEQEYDFGRVAPTSRNEHRFTIHNTSQAAWTLKTAHIGCSCVVTAMSHPIVAPGATEEVTVTLSLGDKEGRFKNSVLLEFQERDSPRIRLCVMATVHRPLSCSQDILVVNPVRCGTREEQSVRLSNYSGEKYNSLMVKGDAGWVTARLHETAMSQSTVGQDAPLETWNVDLVLDGDHLLDGWNETVLRFQPLDTEGPEARLVVRAFRAPSVSVEPSAVFCGIVDRGDSLTRVLRFTFQNSLEVPDISDITAGTEEVPTQLLWKRDPDDPTTILLTMTIGTTGHTLNDHLNVDFGERRTLRIPVRGCFRDNASQQRSPGHQSRSKDGAI
jgi:hypothetical protein